MRCDPQSGRMYRNMVRTASRATVIALAVAAVLLSYPVWMGFDGPQHFTGPQFNDEPVPQRPAQLLGPGTSAASLIGDASLGSRLAIEPTRGGRRLHRCPSPHPHRIPRLAVPS